MIKKKKILIMGLPGAGKTTLAKYILRDIKAVWVNADEVRKKFNDWDFSENGRIRQALRMKEISDKAIKNGNNVVADFICPTPKTRLEFNADYLVWVDTIQKGRFDDTNYMFVKPTKFNMRVNTKNAEFWSKKIIDDLNLSIQK